MFKTYFCELVSGFLLNLDKTTAVEISKFHGDQAMGGAITVKKLSKNAIFCVENDLKL